MREILCTDCIYAEALRDIIYCFIHQEALEGQNNCLEFKSYEEAKMEVKL